MRLKPHRTVLTALALSLSFTAVTGVAQAQTYAPAPASLNPYLGVNITRTYSIADLMNRPGLLTLGKGDMLFIDYDSEVDVIVTPQVALMDIPEPLGNLVIITGKVSSGNAQMMVRLTDGKYTPFMINFTPGSGTMKRIRVTDTPRVDYAQPLPTPNVASNEMPQYAPPTGASGASTYDLSRFTTPITAALNTAPLNRSQPGWLSAVATLQDNAVSISLTNGGPRELTLSNKDLDLSLEGRAVTVNLSQLLRIPAGQTQVVTFPLTGTATPGADLSATWLAFDAGANTYYRVAIAPRQ